LQQVSQTLQGELDCILEDLTSSNANLEVFISSRLMHFSEFHHSTTSRALDLCHRARAHRNGTTSSRVSSGRCVSRENPQSLLIELQRERQQSVDADAKLASRSLVLSQELQELVLLLKSEDECYQEGVGAAATPVERHRREHTTEGGLLELDESRAATFFTEVPESSQAASPDPPAAALEGYDGRIAQLLAACTDQQLCRTLTTEREVRLDSRY
jgi:hypothetical protein